MGYLNLLAEAGTKHEVAVHAYVLMTNHVHLMVTPSTPDGLSMLMQSLGRSFVSRINRTYSRTGTLWEGRFKCSVIETDRYCLACCRYIDLNPLRAHIVTDPGDYRWSSYRHNALGARSGLLTPHPSYVSLGATRDAQAARYQQLVEDSVDEDSVKTIRYGIRKGLPIGSDRFKHDIARQLGIPIGTGRIGRPEKKS